MSSHRFIPTLVRPAQARRSPSACPHRPPCPGCPRFGETGISAESRVALQDLARRHGLSGVEIVSGATAGFRHRARLAIRGRLGSPKIGLFELGTHHVVQIPSCSAHHPLINRVTSVVRGALVDAKVTTYSDKAHLGLARYLQVVVERSSQSAQVVLVGNSPTAEPLAACLDLVRERLGPDLHSLWFNSQCEPTNTILGSHFEKWCGPDTVVERFGGAAVHYPPGAFGQNNLEIAEAIIGQLRARVPQGARVAEFYAGVGAIGLSLLARVSTLRLNELSPQSLQGLERAIADLSDDDRGKVSVIAGGRAGEARAVASGADVVIVDPPRKGLDAELLKHLCDEPPERLLYVSCGLDAFMKDTERLTASGRLRLTELTAFNLMPFTQHVETVACFDRTG